MKLKVKILFLIFIISLSNLLIINSQSIQEGQNDNAGFKTDDKINFKAENKPHLTDSTLYSNSINDDSNESEKAEYFKLRSSPGLISFFNEVLFYWFQHP